MKAEALKKRFGDEYPAAVVVKGIRLPLRRERRFSRSYHSDDKMGSEVSRFMDGSASITASELQREWHTWSDDQRLDFCESCCWLHKQADFPDMLRFIMQHAAPDEWSAIASSVASQLPRDEAFDLLLRALRTVEIGHTSNIGQGIAITKHPDAELTLRRHLRLFGDTLAFGKMPSLSIGWLLTLPRASHISLSLALRQAISRTVCVNSRSTLALTIAIRAAIFYPSITVG